MVVRIGGSMEVMAFFLESQAGVEMVLDQVQVSSMVEGQEVDLFLLMKTLPCCRVSIFGLPERPQVEAAVEELDHD